MIYDRLVMDANYYMHFDNYVAKGFSRDYNVVSANPAEKEHLFSGSYDYADHGTWDAVSHELHYDTKEVFSSAYSSYAADSTNYLANNGSVPTVTKDEKIIRDGVAAQVDEIRNMQLISIFGRQNPLGSFDEYNGSREYARNKIAGWGTDNKYYHATITLTNSYGDAKQIDTIYGKAEVFLDIDDSGSVSVGGEELLRGNYELLSLDTNRDALLDKNDRFFDKLKVRGYDAEGNEVIKKLSDVVDSIDLREFLKTNEQIKEETGLNLNVYQNFKAELRYEKISDDDRAELAKMADAEGWIDVSNLKNTPLAYAKSNADGGVRLEEVFATQTRYVGNGDMSSSKANNKFVGNYVEKKYADVQFKRFMSLYENYQSELAAQKKLVSNYADWYSGSLDDLKSEAMIKMEFEFEKATGMDFSLSNLDKVKNAFLSNKERTAATLMDTDELTAIRLNDGGSFTLRFSSGREVTVSELYKDSGSIFEAGVSLNLDALNLSDEELNELDFGTIGVKYADPENAHKERLATLKELGVKAIKTLAKDRYGYLLLSLENGKEMEVRKEFFNMLKKASERASIDPRERFYPKPVNILA